MKTKHEQKAINRILMSHGLGALNDGAGLMAQLGFLIESHDELREALKKCEPQERVHMYDSLKPYLRFEAKPLDVYISELGQIAEAKRLPIVHEDGSLTEYRAPEIKSKDLETAQRVIEEEAAAKHLALVCSQCTRQDHYSGWCKDEAIKKARAAGWRYCLTTHAEICPNHP